MKIVAISDVHIKFPGDDAEKLIVSFFQNQEVQTADQIYLLGDIFDLVIGPHSQYFNRYQVFFAELAKLLRAGKKVYYVEGNHDFHLNKLFQNFFEVFRDIPKKNFELKKEFETVSGGKTIHLSHGDDIEIDNFSYKIFKFIVTSWALTIFANYFMPYFLIKNIGETASRLSRARNNKRYKEQADLTPVLKKFRKSYEIFFHQRPFDIYVAGHSHVQDDFVSSEGFEYVNNGYAQFTKTFIIIENGNVKFSPL